MKPKIFTVALSRGQALRQSTFIIQRLGLVLLANAMLVAASYVQIPLSPVPVTLQTVAVLLIIASMGARYSTLTIGLYLVEGAFGLPVFAGGAVGAGVLFGPTGGFLWGFLLAAMVSGYVLSCGAAQRYASSIATMLLSTLVIFGCGYAVLSLYVGASAAYVLGVKPFIFLAALKVGVVSMLIPSLWVNDTDD